MPGLGIRIVGCLIIVGGLAASAAAQLPSSTAAFTGTGTARLTRVPQRMRVMIPVTESAETVREALDALTEAATTVNRDLVKLGAKTAQINTTQPDIQHRSAAGADMFGMMAALGGGADAGPDDNGLVSVELVVTADFLLPDDDPATLLESAWNIQREIRDAEYDFGTDVGGVNMQQAILQQAMDGDAGQDPQKTGFLFLAPVTPAERTALLKDAYDKARLDAEELAMAAGKQLGELQIVRRDGEATGYAEMARSMMAGNIDDEQRFLRDDEFGLMAIGTTPGAVELRVIITAGFAAAP